MSAKDYRGIASAKKHYFAEYFFASAKEYRGIASAKEHCGIASRKYYSFADTKEYY